MQQTNACTTQQNIDLRYAIHLDILTVIIGTFLSVFVHELGHLFAAVCFGDKPSLVFAQGYFGPGFLVNVGIDYGWKYWTVLLSGPLLSGFVLYLLSQQNMLWGFRIAAVLQFLYVPFEVMYISSVMGYLDYAVVVMTLILYLVSVAFFSFLLICRRLS